MISHQHESSGIRRGLSDLLVGFRKGGIVLLLATAMTLAIVILQADAPKQGDIVTADEFLMTDSSGATRARLGMDGGSVGLTLFDRRGVGRLVLKVDEDGTPEIALMDGQKTKRAQFTLTGGKIPELVFLDVGKPSERIKLGISEEGEGYLRIFDTKTQNYWTAPQDSDRNK